MYALLNIGSLIFGSAAWALAGTNVAKAKQSSLEHQTRRSFLSMAACASALLFQIIYHHHLVMIQDIAAIYDTTSTTLVVSCILLIVTISLNTIAFVRTVRSEKLSQERC